MFIRQIMHQFPETVIVVRYALIFQKNVPEVCSAVTKECQAVAVIFHYYTAACKFNIPIIITCFRQVKVVAIFIWRNIGRNSKYFVRHQAPGRCTFPANFYMIGQAPEAQRSSKLHIFVCVWLNRLLYL